MKYLVKSLTTIILYVCSLVSYGQDRPTMERFFSISPTSAQFESQGGVKTFTVSSSSSWEIASYPKSFGQLTRNGNTLTLHVDANTEPSPRSSYFDLATKEKKIRVTFSQAEGASLSVSMDNLSFSSEGGTQTITITTNKSWSIDTSTASWGHLSRNGNQITVKVDKNSGNSSRSDWFSVKAGDKAKRINISQAGEQATSLSVSSSELTFSSSGGTQSITISSNKSWSIDTSTASWGHLSRNGNQITVKVDKNSGNSSRNDWFSVKAGDKAKRINISQAGEQATSLSVSSSELTFSSSGGTQSITISSNKSWSIDTSTASWGHLSRNGNQITVKVDRNPGNSSRNDWFSIKAGDKVMRINISQAKDNTNLSVSKSELTFNSEGGTQTITINSNKSWDINTSAASWWHLSRNGNQLTVKADKNSGNSSRNDWFSIKAEDKIIRINISQAKDNTNLSVSDSQLSFSHNGGTQTITVTSNKTWNIGTKSASWALLSKNGNQLTVKVDKNPSHYTRDSYFTVRANNKEKSINITQYGKPRRRFNHAKDNYWGGFSMGYIRKQWTQKTDDETVKYGLFDNSKYLTGIQAGLRIDPQFGAGFGMNTGIFYEYCWDKSDEDYDEYGSYHYTYEEHGLYAPLHLKFNMNFNEAFQLSFYGGAGFNYVFTGKLYLRDEGITYNSENVFEEEDGWEPFNLMLEYGASIRISAFQFDFSISKGLTNWSEDETYKETQGRPFNVSMTICF